MPTLNPDTSPLVLLLHSDPATARLVHLYLEPLGCKVFSTSRTEEAIHQVPVERPALILMDQGLYEGPKPYSLERIRTCWPHRPVYNLISPRASLDAQTPENSTHARPDGTFTKPLQSGPLIAMIQKALEDHPGSPVARPAPGPGPAQGSGPAPSAELLAEFEAWIEEMEMGEELIWELTDSFIERGSSYMVDLGEQVAAGKSQSLEKVDQATHALKGMAGNLRFNVLFNINEMLRAKIKAGDPITPEDFDRLDQAFKAIHGALQGSPWLKQ